MRNVLTSRVNVEAKARASPAQDASMEGFRRMINARNPIKAPVIIWNRTFSQRFTEESWLYFFISQDIDSHPIAQ
jgi:hypothetical protein